MAAEQKESQNIKNQLPAPTATLDLHMGIVDSTGVHVWAIDAANHGPVELFAGGTSLTMTGSNLNVNVAADGTVKKISRDGSAPLAANASFVENVTGAGPAIVAAGNPLAAQLSQGNAVLSATNGVFANILQGNAVISATHGLFTNVLQGDAVLSATHGLFTNILNGDAILSASNTLAMRLSNGTAFNAVATPVFSQLVGGVGPALITSTNPLPVFMAVPQTTGTRIYPFDDNSGTGIAGGGAHTHNYTPSGALDGYIERIYLSAPGYAHFRVTNDGTVIADVRVSPAHPTFELAFPEDEPLKVLNTKTLAIIATNDGSDTIVLASWSYGFEV